MYYVSVYLPFVQATENCICFSQSVLITFYYHLFSYFFKLYFLSYLFIIYRNNN